MFGKLFGWYLLSDKSSAELIAEKRRVFVVSFPGDRDVGELEVGIGNIVGSDGKSGLVKYDASTAPGSSGGAVFIIENGSMRLVGLHVGGKRDGDRYSFKTYSNNVANYYIPAGEFIRSPGIEPAIEHDKALNGDANIAEGLARIAPDLNASMKARRLVMIDQK